MEVPGATVNRLCGSGLEAIASAARAIAAGEADICLAGGVESMTRAPFVLPRAADPFPREAGVADTRLGWRLVSPRMQEMYPPVSLGETAENVAERYRVSRERQDEFALRSHRRAAAAQEEGRFDGEIVPVSTGAGELASDEGVTARPDAWTSWRRNGPRSARTARSPAATPHRSTTARPCLLLCLASGCGRAGVGRWPGTRAPPRPGCTPTTWGSGRCRRWAGPCGRAGWRLDELDLIEVNEAFAAQVGRGGGRAQGSTRTGSTSTAARSPSATRSAAPAPGSPTTLLHEFRRRGAARGAASMCIGVGQGIASLWEAA